MLSRIHNKLGTAGLVVAIVALVAALGGAAYAAAGFTKAQEKQIAKIAKKAVKRGPKGAPGATGPQGPAGAPGAPGAKGATGAQGIQGKTGATGEKGANGTSVTNTAIPAGNAKCNELGGAEFKVGTGTPTFACNGLSGFTEVLPKGKTETGTWATAAAGGVQMVSLPFNIPLKAAPKATVAVGVDLINPITEVVETNKTKVYCPGGGEACASASDCPGTAANPEATEGVLCVYEDRSLSSENGSEKEAYFLKGFFEELNARYKTGGTLAFFYVSNGHLVGTYAVTGT